MTDFLTRLDSADPASVPGLCLLYADYLSERGEPSDGWRALGLTRKRPDFHEEGRFFWWWDGVLLGMPDKWLSTIPRPKGDVVSSFPSRSSALAAAAQAFEGLEDEVKREILKAKMEAVT